MNSGIASDVNAHAVSVILGTGTFSHAVAYWSFSFFCRVN